MEQKDCINPNESLAELLQKRNRLKQEIIKNYALGGNGSLQNFQKESMRLDKELVALNAQITSIEHAANTGGIIRIM
jgi:hypothetical protein